MCWRQGEKGGLHKRCQGGLTSWQTDIYLYVLRGGGGVKKAGHGNGCQECCQFSTKHSLVYVSGVHLSTLVWALNSPLWRTMLCWGSVENVMVMINWFDWFIIERDLICFCRHLFIFFRHFRISDKFVLFCVSGIETTSGVEFKNYNSEVCVCFDSWSEEHQEAGLMCVFVPAFVGCTPKGEHRLSPGGVNA